MTDADAKVHEEWNRGKLKENGNDIALVRLPKPAYTMFEIGSGVHVAPVCLPWGELPSGNIATYPKGKTQSATFHVLNEECISAQNIQVIFLKK